MARYESWIDRQIREAIERGEFDNLPGAGKPLPGINGREDENWWIKQKLRDEDLSPALPTVLSLRREVERLPETLADVRREEDAREIVEDLNERIRDSYRRRVDGPLIPIRTVNVDEALDAWRRRRAPGGGE
jgi:hypothetical protein